MNENIKQIYLTGIVLQETYVYDPPLDEYISPLERREWVGSIIRYVDRNLEFHEHRIGRVEIIWENVRHPDIVETTAHENSFALLHVKAGPLIINFTPDRSLSYCHPEDITGEEFPPDLAARVNI